MFNYGLKAWHLPSDDSEALIPVHGARKGLLRVSTVLGSLIRLGALLAIIACLVVMGICIVALLGHMPPAVG